MFQVFLLPFVTLPTIIQCHYFECERLVCLDTMCIINSRSNGILSSGKRTISFSDECTSNTSDGDYLSCTNVTPPSDLLGEQMQI